MTQKSIDEQIEVLKAVGERASVSREAAADFLRSAGITFVAKNGAAEKEHSKPGSKNKSVSIPPIPQK